MDVFSREYHSSDLTSITGVPLVNNNPDIYFVSRSTPKILGLGFEKVPLALPLLTSSVEITHIRYTHHEAGDGTSKKTSISPTPVEIGVKFDHS